MKLQDRLYCAAGLIGALGFAIAQPLFDLIGREPVFLQQHAVGGEQLLLLIAWSWFLPGLALAGVILLCGALSRRLTLALYALPMFALTAVTAMPALRGWNSWLALGMAALAAGALVFALLRSQRVRALFALTALAPLVFSLVFIMRPEVRAVVWPPEEEGALRPLRQGELRDLIVVVLDELPLTHLLRDADQLDEQRFPNLAALAADAIWYRNVLAVSAYTQHAVPAIFAGQLNGEPPTRARYPQNLFTLLERDYQLIASESLTDLCPDEYEKVDPSSRAHRWDLLISDCVVLLAHRVLPERLARGLPQVDAQWTGFGNDQPLGEGRPAKFRAWIQRLQPGFKPTLGAIHQVFPHNPYNYYPDGRRYSYRGEEPYKYGGRWIADELAAEQAWMRSLLQAQAADRLIGELVAQLRSVGLYDRMVLAVVADHGVSFQGGGFARRLGAGNRPDILGVPFFLKLPGQRRAGTIDRRLVSTLDVLPTIAEAAGFALPWESQGRSMLDPDAEARTTALFVDVDDHDRKLSFDVSVLDGQAATFRRKVELLEAGEYAITSSRQLSGSPLRALERGEDSSFRLRLNESRLGAEFQGELIAEAPLRQPVEIAAVVRDSIVALTRTLWDDPTRRGGEFWLLLPPQRRGPVRWFEIAEGPVLHALRIDGGASSYLGRRLASEEVEGVRSTGFRSAFVRDGQRQRWTGAQASLLVPLAPEDMVRRLRLVLGELRGDEWALRVNGREIYRGRDVGTRDFELPGIEGQLHVELSAAGGADPGILVRGLWLF